MLADDTRLPKVEFDPIFIPASAKLGVISQMIACSDCISQE